MAVHHTFASLGNKLEKIGEILEDNVTNVVRGTALVVDQVVIAGTPVLSGRARSGWDVAIGVEPNTIPSDDPVSAEAGAAAALSQGRTAIESYKAGMAGIYISNGLPYIKRLEDGYSAQAPAGMVSQAVAAGREFVQSQKLLKGVR